MCGIFGIIGKNQVTDNLIDGLKRLEYRGYDSSGIAVICDGALQIEKAGGKIRQLEKKIGDRVVPGTIGIAHTRWATHGQPITENAHPHSNGRIAVVHNGIIENFKVLRTELEELGYNFVSDTDTEIIPYLLDYFLNQGDEIHLAVRKLLAKIQGAFALGIIIKDYPDLLIATKRGSPLVIGIGVNEQYIGSDAFVIAPLTTKISYLEDDDVVFLTGDKAEFFDSSDQLVKRDLIEQNISQIYVGKENYRHFMQKEIDEQPTVIANLINTYYDRITNVISFDKVELDYSKIDNIVIVACGTSLYSGEVAKYWFEEYSDVTVRLYIASEFIHHHKLNDNDLVILISQSGETADTLKALKLVKEQNKQNLVIVNTQISSMSNIADNIIYLHAGPEIGVASTKAFSAQLSVFALLSLKIAQEKKLMDEASIIDIMRNFRRLPAKISQILNNQSQIKTIANKVLNSSTVLYIGRGVSYGIAKEAALKLKELSYIHAEGIAAGELKHGPIALIDEDLYVIVIAPSNDNFNKLLSNVQEVSARGGRVVFISEAEGINEIKDLCQDFIELPKVKSFLAPILYTVPVQLLAYYVAVYKGTDVDQPRNLAKSVTVE
ncbi:MAG: glutamine--fructose-6-phosphate transaminase (isomerizing) [Rickettsiales bacterium]|jgi:glutamine---fructose-6-phosphate transaminase (isomerizing)|nr:glutamine--fructose-6-phosphate transaminase (isomerizing) [Rickettsiales bacterium]